MSLPRITVLLAVHNGLPYLDQAVESILGQTFVDFEFLIIDDGSTDSSREYVQGIDDPRIRLLVNERNLGLTRSLNLGLKEAKGEYVARQDADDVSLPQRLEVQAGYLDRHPQTGLAGCSVEYMDSYGKTEVSDSRGMSHGVLAWHLFFGNEIPHSGVMFRTQEVRDLGGYDESLPFSQDYDLWSRLARRTGLVRLERILLRYRRHQEALSATRREEQYLIRDRISQANMAGLLGKDPDLETIRALREPGRERGRTRAAAGLIRDLGRVYLETAELTPDEAREIRADIRLRLKGLARSCFKRRPLEGLALFLGRAGAD